MPRQITVADLQCPPNLSCPAHLDGIELVPFLQPREAIGIVEGRAHALAGERFQPRWNTPIRQADARSADECVQLVPVARLHPASRIQQQQTAVQVLAGRRRRNRLRGPLASAGHQQVGTLPQRSSDLKALLREPTVVLGLLQDASRGGRGQVIGSERRACVAARKPSVPRGTRFGAEPGGLGPVGGRWRHLEELLPRKHNRPAGLIRVRGVGALESVSHGRPREAALGEERQPHALETREIQRFRDRGGLHLAAAQKGACEQQHDQKSRPAHRSTT